jgi:hypothetical protein
MEVEGRRKEVRRKESGGISRRLEAGSRRQEVGDTRNERGGRK